MGENKTDDWGDKLLDAWMATGMGTPEVIAETEIDLGLQSGTTQ